MKLGSNLYMKQWEVEKGGLKGGVENRRKVIHKKFHISESIIEEVEKMT